MTIVPRSRTPSTSPPQPRRPKFRFFFSPAPIFILSSPLLGSSCGGCGSEWGPEGWAPENERNGCGRANKVRTLLGGPGIPTLSGFPSGKAQNLRGAHEVGPKCLNFPSCDGFTTNSEKRLPSSLFQTQSHHLGTFFNDALSCAAQNFALLFSGPNIHSFFPSLGVFLWNCESGSRPNSTQNMVEASSNHFLGDCVSRSC